MRYVSPVLFCLIAAAAAAQPAMAEGVGSIVVNDKQVSISGNGYKRTYPCNGRPATVEGTDHVITFTGTCASLEVNGVNNRISIELVPGARLGVNGTENEIRWRSRGEPKQDLGGIDNKIVREPLPK